MGGRPYPTYTPLMANVPGGAQGNMFDNNPADVAGSDAKEHAADNID